MKKIMHLTPGIQQIVNSWMNKLFCWSWAGVGRRQDLIRGDEILFLMRIFQHESIMIWWESFENWIGWNGVKGSVTNILTFLTSCDFKRTFLGYFLINFHNRNKWNPWLLSGYKINFMDQWSHACVSSLALTSNN